MPACDAAIQQAAKVDSMADTVADLDPALEQCPSVADFEAATSQFPDALDGVPALAFLANRCAIAPSLASTAICAELDGLDLAS